MGSLVVSGKVPREAIVRSELRTMAESSQLWPPLPDLHATDDVPFPNGPANSLSLLKGTLQGQNILLMFLDTLSKEG